MDIFRRKGKLFEERVAGMFKAMFTNAENTADLLENGNPLIILEIYTFLFFMLDYSLVINRADPGIREAVNKAHYDMFRLSRHWANLHVSNLSQYTNDRLGNYSDIIRNAGGVSADYFQNVIEYQTQLIAWIKKEQQVRIGFVAVPKIKDDYRPIITELTLIYEIQTILTQVYTDILLGFVSMIIKNAKNDYFMDHRYQMVK